MDTGCGRGVGDVGEVILTSYEFNAGATFSTVQARFGQLCESTGAAFDSLTETVTGTITVFTEATAEPSPARRHSDSANTRLEREVARFEREISVLSS